MIKLDARLEELISEGRVRTKWSEIEDYGVAELINMLFNNDSAEDSVAATAAVDNRMVCMQLYEGILYEHGGEVYNLAKAYIDIDDNIVFAARSGELFLYETNSIDAEDPKHYFGNE